MKHNSPNTKKKIVKFFVIALVVLAVLAIIVFFIEKADKNKAVATPEIPTYNFCDPDYNSDIFKDESYLAKDRYIAYTNEMGETVRLTDDTVENYGVGPSFFALYIYSLESGDSNLYSTLFTDEYKSKNKLASDFTMQKIYGIELKYQSKERIDDNSYTETYSLDYCIMKNDGTFRYDIGSDMSRTQYITLYCTEDDAKINNIKTEFKK